MALLEAISQEIEGLSARSTISTDQAALRDVRRMEAVPRPPLPTRGLLSYDQCRLAVEYLVELSEVGQGLTLIVDQAEELLGSGLGRPDPEREDEILQILGLILDDAKGIHLLVSLRQEYLGRLLPLSRHVDGLDRRTVEILPIKRSVIEEVIEGPLQRSSSVRMNRIAIDEILSWLTRPDTPDQRADADERPIDLLRLQALLVDILLALRNRSSPGVLEVNQESLQQYLGGRHPSDLAKLALERHLERLLSSVAPRDADPWLLPLARRLGARAGTWLSSPGGFKRPTEEGELLYNLLRDDLAALGVESGADEAVRALRAFRGESTSALPILRLIPENPHDPTPWSSGPSRLWTRDRTVAELVRAAHILLDHLVDSSVLKRYLLGREHAGERKLVYELIHDGFGPALLKFGETERNRMRDAIAAVVSQRGTSFNWDHTERAVEDVSWLGCSVRRVAFQGVVFRNCVLSGTVFIDCTFEHCRFESCILDGSVFVGPHSSLEDHVWAGGTAASVMFSGTRLRDVQFKSIKLDGATFKDVRVCGRVLFQAVRLPFSQLHRLHPQEDCTVNFLDCDLRNCLLEDLEEAFLHVDENTQRSGLVLELPMV
jgi:uncharacterized protein YjbI with pentapeptide repeats